MVMMNVAQGYQIRGAVVLTDIAGDSDARKRCRWQRASVYILMNLAYIKDGGFNLW